MADSLKTVRHSIQVARMTGLSLNQVEWTWRRLVDLVQIEGMNREDAVEIVGRESVGRPWNAPEFTCLSN